MTNKNDGNQNATEMPAYIATEYALWLQGEGGYDDFRQNPQKSKVRYKNVSYMLPEHMIGHARTPKSAPVFRRTVADNDRKSFLDQIQKKLYS